jgi:hypothetical protein
VRTVLAGRYSEPPLTPVRRLEGTLAAAVLASAHADDAAPLILASAPGWARVHAARNGHALCGLDAPTPTPAEGLSCPLCRRAASNLGLDVPAPTGPQTRSRVDRRARWRDRHPVTVSHPFPPAFYRARGLLGAAVFYHGPGSREARNAWAVYHAVRNICNGWQPTRSRGRPPQ